LCVNVQAFNQIVNPTSTDPSTTEYKDMTQWCEGQNKESDKTDFDAVRFCKNFGDFCVSGKPDIVAICDNPRRLP
jgi:hypothetical protein